MQKREGERERSQQKNLERYLERCSEQWAHRRCLPWSTDRPTEMADDVAAHFALLFLVFPLPLSISLSLSLSLLCTNLRKRAFVPKWISKTGKRTCQEIRVFTNGRQGWRTYSRTQRDTATVRREGEKRKGKSGWKSKRAERHLLGHSAKQHTHRQPNVSMIYEMADTVFTASVCIRESECECDSTNKQSVMPSIDVPHRAVKKCPKYMCVCVFVCTSFVCFCKV